MTEPPDHPGYGVWLEPVKARDHFLRNPKIANPPPFGSPRPRQCLISDDDAISFSLARQDLEDRWGATPEEIYLWLATGHPALHGFAGGLELWDYVEDPLGNEYRILRCAPGISDSTRPCVDFYNACTFPRMLANEAIGSAVEILTHLKFSRTEVEAFDPSHNEFDTDKEIQYFVESVGKMGVSWYNPSGRFLSYDRTLAFLTRYCRDAAEASAIIKRDYGCRNLNGFTALGPTLWLHAVERELPAECVHYLEGQVVGLAKMEFGACITRWDAVTQPGTPHGSDTHANSITESNVSGERIPRVNPEDQLASGRKVDPRMKAAYLDAVKCDNKTVGAKEAIEKHYAEANQDKKDTALRTLRAYLQPGKTPKWAKEATGQ